jgi:hypothetical protein
LTTKAFSERRFTTKEKIPIFPLLTFHLHVATKGNSPYSSVPDIIVHQPEAYKPLHNINQRKATGPNTISGILLKELASEISPILTTIYNASIKQGKIPNQWKEALITPF